MAQLKDDCFAFGDALIPYEDAMADLAKRLVPVVGTETVPLVNACLLYTSPSPRD